MPYVTSDGSVEDNRTMFRLSIVSDAFWMIANTVALFVKTLVDPRAAIPKGKYISNSRSSSSNSSGNRSYRPPVDGAPKGSNIKTLPKNCAS
eukprot:CAMPEP_0181294130 /NCGR_PEP_ID=MMETSP1101-20121128/3431_1 /TAXON_ID=46948 /ORGANISM="Rhodomonas abbreviata, Strain Caron Lab Isolate" /LENGTH=91 /DNA_ID=CAMNT_0023398757 /DNA_START=29 /DNA_END=304 /DNA_ORIENTATION=-